MGFLLGHFISLKLEDAQDIAQEAFLFAWQTYDHTRGPFFAWSIKLARNKAVDYFRSARESFQRKMERPGYLSQHPNVPPSKADKDLGLREELLIRLLSYRQIVRLLLLCAGYPHEVLAYAYAKGIYGKVDQGGTIRVSAQDMDRKFGLTSLGDLERDLPSRWTEAPGLGEEELDRLIDYFRPVRLRSEMGVQDLLRSNAPAAMENILVRDTRWRDYYPPGYSPDKQKQTHPLSYWFDRVEKRLRAILVAETPKSIDGQDNQTLEVSLTPGSGSRCKLRHAPPCSDSRKYSLNPSLVEGQCYSVMQRVWRKFLWRG